MFTVLRASVLGLLILTPIQAEEVVPWQTPKWSVESGVLWKIGTETPLPYRLVTTQLAWRTRAIFDHAFTDGSHLVLRHRFGLIGTWVQTGPESLYAGFTASPSIEWWNPTSTWALYAGAGGGVGWIDSTDVIGGQGQDFTLNWFMRGGVERAISPHTSATLGIMFQHMSNGGQTDPNPGIDALGFSLGFSRRF